MIVVITNKNDIHADVVIKRLYERDAKFLRINTEDFPQKIHLNLQLSAKSDMRLLIKTPIGEVLAENVLSVWYRRPKDPIVYDYIGDISLKHLALSESKVALNWCWECFSNAFWVNIPQNNKLASNKILQMKAAMDFGFRVPDSIITNNPQDVENFLSKYEEIVVKPISGGMISTEGDIKLIYTNRLSKGDKRQIKLVRYAPTFFQEYIPKAYELRITVVGSKVFACQINSQSSEKTKDDWRRYDFENVKHLPYQLPQKVEQFCQMLVKHFCLNFGTIDMIVTPDGEYVFLEINPNGQWFWIERLTGLPISESIAELLTNPPAL